jgi:hypothetical protein
LLFGKEGTPFPDYPFLGMDMKEDKRQHKRFPVNQFITAKFAGDPQTMNLNKTGVCVCGLLPFAENGNVDLTFHFKQGPEQESLEQVSGVVKWAVQLGTFHTAGIQFSALLSEEDQFLTVALIELAKEFETG